jgi:hypothetical protein
LKPQDFEARVNYCHWFQQTFDNDDLLDLTFYSDEARFMLSGYVNSQNFRIWSTDNPHAYLEAPLHSQIVICIRRLENAILQARFVEQRRH